MSDLCTSVEVGLDDIGQRLDQVLANHFPEHSRARLQRWIKAGQITVDGVQVRPSQRLLRAQRIDIDVTIEPVMENRPQDLEIEPHYVDDQIIVINKPAGLVVHPAAGNADGTLLNALLHFDAGLNALPRAGIVHRLDKDTTGLLVVARTLTAHTSLVRQLEARTVSRQYKALVYGQVIAGDTIDLALGRHPVDRKKMAVREAGREAITHYRVAQRFRNFSLLSVALETGRTHQIRVHLAHRRHAIVGDPVYGVRLRLPAGAGEPLKAALAAFKRQALHASRLSFEHPGNGEPATFEVPLPADMRALLNALETDPEQT